MVDVAVFDVVVVVVGFVAVGVVVDDVVDVVVGGVGRPSSMSPNPGKRSPVLRGNQTRVRCVRSGVTAKLRHSFFYY